MSRLLGERTLTGLWLATGALLAGEFEPAAPFGVIGRLSAGKYVKSGGCAVENIRPTVPASRSPSCSSHRLIAAGVTRAPGASADGCGRRLPQASACMASLASAVRAESSAAARHPPSTPIANLNSGTTTRPLPAASGSRLLNFRGVPQPAMSRDGQDWAIRWRGSDGLPRSSNRHA